MSKSRDCGHRQGWSPGLPEGRGEVFTVGSVGPLVEGACGPYHRMKPGGQKSGSHAVATGGPGGDPYPRSPAVRLHYHLRGRLPAQQLGGDPPGRAPVHPPGGRARAGQGHLVPHAGGIPHLAGVSNVSAGPDGSGPPGQRADRGARPCAHSPAARAFLLAFSAQFLPRAHYQSDSALRAAARAGEGAGGRAPTEGRGGIRSGQVGRARLPERPPPELHCGRGSAGAGMASRRPRAELGGGEQVAG